MKQAIWEVLHTGDPSLCSSTHGVGHATGHVPAAYNSACLFDWFLSAGTMRGSVCS